MLSHKWEHCTSGALKNVGAEERIAYYGTLPSRHGMAWPLYPGAHSCSYLHETGPINQYLVMKGVRTYKVLTTPNDLQPGVHEALCFLKEL